MPLVMLSACNTAAKRHAAEEKAKAVQAAEFEQATRAQAAAAEFKKRDEEAAARLALQYQAAPTIDDSQFGARRSALAKLAANPRSSKPKSVVAPGVESFTTYEYDVDGLGAVIQWRTSSADWALSMQRVSRAA